MAAQFGHGVKVTINGVLYSCERVVLHEQERKIEITSDAILDELASLRQENAELRHILPDVIADKPALATAFEEGRREGVESCCLEIERKAKQILADSSPLIDLASSLRLCTIREGEKAALARADMEEACARDPLVHHALSMWQSGQCDLLHAALIGLRESSRVRQHLMEKVMKLHERLPFTPSP